MSKDTDQTPQCVKTDVSSSLAKLQMDNDKLLDCLSNLSSAISSGNPHLLSEWNLKSKTLLYLLKK